MARFTKAFRQQIVQDFCRRHNGLFTPELFLEEVQTTGPRHPAYEWFEWDDGVAAMRQRLQEAREFARDIRITFVIEETEDRPVRVTISEAPLVLSPLASRTRGGGYVLTNPEDPEHRAELTRQAIADLEAWVGRYKAIIYLAAARGAVDRLITLLRKMTDQEAA